MEEDLRDESQVLRQTFQRLISKVHQDGFREGLDEGKTRSFQKGFDQGYAQGFGIGFTQACFNGALRTLNAVSLQSAGAALEELASPNKAMCQMCLPSNQKRDSLSEIVAWQRSVARNTELTSKYRTVNQMLNHEVIPMD